MSDDSSDNVNFLTRLAGKAAEGVAAHWGGSFAAVALRLLGNGRDKVKLYLAGGVKEQAQTQAEIELIKAVNKQAVDKLKADPKLLQAATDNLYAKTMREFANKSAVVEEAAKVLDKEADYSEEDKKAAKQPDEAFMGRFEPYAEGASTAELRAKWGKVLASEIRRPGTFSRKIMRIVDELEPETAKLFEEICRWRINNIIPLCLSGVLELPKKKNLENAGLLIASVQKDLESSGLLIAPARGLEGSFDSATNRLDGSEIWYVFAGNLGLGFLKNSKLPNTYSKNPPIRKNGSECSMPSYALTEEGMALASILEDKQQEAFYAYLKKLSEFLPEVEIDELRKTDGDSMRAIRRWKNGKPVS